MQGTPLPAVSRLIGTARPTMTVQPAHMGDQETEAAAERIGTVISGMLGMDQRVLPDEFSDGHLSRTSTAVNRQVPGEQTVQPYQKCNCYSLQHPLGRTRHAVSLRLGPCLYITMLQ